MGWGEHGLLPTLACANAQIRRRSVASRPFCHAQDFCMAEFYFANIENFIFRGISKFTSWLRKRRELSKLLSAVEGLVSATASRVNQKS